MPFLPPNQQRQSTEGQSTADIELNKNSFTGRQESNFIQTGAIPGLIQYFPGPQERFIGLRCNPAMSPRPNSFFRTFQVLEKSEKKIPYLLGWVGTLCDVTADHFPYSAKNRDKIKTLLVRLWLTY